MGVGLQFGRFERSTRLTGASLDSVPRNTGGGSPSEPGVKQSQGEPDFF
jgi:hypothetical protein